MGKLPNNLILYNLARDYINNADLLAWSGRGLASRIIQDATDSEYSHVGITLWMAQPGDSGKRLFTLESTTLDNTPDIDGTYRRGVQIRLLSQVLESYNGRCWWLKLRIPLSDEERIKGFNWAFQKYASKAYYDAVQALQSALDINKMPWYRKLFWSPFTRIIDNQESLRALFCSELVTKFYKECGILSESTNASEMTPADVVNFPLWEPRIQLL